MTSDNEQIVRQAYKVAEEMDMAAWATAFTEDGTFAGAATLPVTVLLLALSTPSGAIAQRIGPRIPLTIGAVLAGTGLLLMARIHPGDRSILGVLPALIVFGVGLGV